MARERRATFEEVEEGETYSQSTAQSPLQETNDGELTSENKGGETQEDGYEPDQEKLGERYVVFRLTPETFHDIETVALNDVV